MLCTRPPAPALHPRELQQDPQTLPQGLGIVSRHLGISGDAGSCAQEMSSQRRRSVDILRTSRDIERTSGDVGRMPGDQRRYRLASSANELMSAQIRSLSKASLETSSESPRMR